MIFYDLTLNKWVRKAGLETSPWETLVIPIGAVYPLAIQFCEGSELVTPSYDTMSLVIKEAGNAAATSLATATAAYDAGNGSVVFEIDLSATANQTDDQTACFMQVAYEIDSVQYLTTLLDVSLQNNYAL